MAFSIVRPSRKRIGRPEMAGENDMPSNLLRAVAQRCGLLFALALMISLAAGQPAEAQAPATDVGRQKVDELIRLLNDPDVRTYLAAQPKPTEQTSAASPVAMKGMSASDFTIFLDGVRDHFIRLARGFPLLPGELHRAGETTMAGVNGRSPGGILLFFLVLVAIGLAGEFSFGLITRRIHRQRLAGGDATPLSSVFRGIGRHLFVSLSPLVVFAAVTLGLFLAMSWPPLLSALIVPTLIGLIAGRLLIRLTHVFLSPKLSAGGEDFPRLVPVDDRTARFWFFRIITMTLIFFVGWASQGIMSALGMLPVVEEVIDYALGLILLAAAIEVVWHRPRANGGRAHHGAFDWLLIFWLCILWLLWVADLFFALWLGIYVLLLPASLKIASSIIKTAYRQAQTEAPSPNNPIFEVLIERSVRAAIIVLAMLWLGLVLQLHATMAMQEAVTSRIIRGVLSGVVILLVADLVWQIAKALIARRLERAQIEEGSAAETARSGRLLTLLPILRNFLAVLIAAVAVMMVLSGLGVEVGPLIAGAGIFGVAIGFGSQTLVKDVISGIFYMLDDAFRIGEYIQSGSYKGTVEAFSIRSVKLRHHRGPVFTVPFGSLGAVENMSRDWVIDKFMISVSYQTDIAAVRKLIKGVGAALLDDPDFGAKIIETLKMKGVEQFGDYGINLSFAMTTKPGEQSMIRRRAFAMIRDVFVANGIEFASPTVQVAHGMPPGDVVAALAVNNAVTQKKIEGEATG